MRQGIPGTGNGMSDGRVARGRRLPWDPGAEEEEE